MYFFLVSGEDAEYVDKEAFAGRVLRHLRIYARKVRKGLYVITDPQVIDTYRRAVCFLFELFKF